MFPQLSRRSGDNPGSVAAGRPRLRKLVERIYLEQLYKLRVQASRTIACILLVQWVVAICCAVWISPFTWEGTEYSLHVHVASAVGIGGLLTIFPCFLSIVGPGARVTRLATASAQVLYSALLIHLMGGRIETHFHVFGSLALLAAYKDKWVYLPAVAIVAADHLVRGAFWPESVFGVASISLMRALEHAGWIVFATVFLLWGVEQSLGSLRRSAELQASLIDERDLLESRIEDRTQEIERQRSVQAAIMQTIPAAVFWKDAEHRFLGCNDTFAFFLGLKSRDDIVGKTNAEVQYIANRIRDKNSCLQDRSPDDPPRLDVEESLTRADGSRRYVLSSASTLQSENGETFGSLGIFHDITELKEAQSHATGLAQVIRDSPSEIYIFDGETLQIIEANMGVCENLGYSRTELLSMSPLEFTPTFDEAQLRLMLNKAIDDDTLKCKFNATHTRRDGTSYPVQIDAHWAALDSKWVYVAFVQDLSEQQAMQQQLSQAQKLESMGQMAAGIAHEINTPMQCVSGNVEFLQSSYDRLFSLTDELIEIAGDENIPLSDRSTRVEELVDRARYKRIQAHTPDAIEDAAVAVQRVIEIVRAMKSMSHPGHRDCSEVDINDLLEKAAVISRNRWKYVAEVTTELEPDLPSVQAYPAELSQVFINMLVNAADAIAEQNEKNKLGEIRLATECNGQQVVVTITDTGCGMNDEVRQKVFDQFFTTKDVGQGTGLGLALSYDIVANKHQGAIDVTSQPGEGTTFRISLPIRLARKVPNEQNEAELSTPVAAVGHMPSGHLPTTIG